MLSFRLLPYNTIESKENRCREIVKNQLQDYKLNNYSEGENTWNSRTPLIASLTVVNHLLEDLVELDTVG